MGGVRGGQGLHFLHCLHGEQRLHVTHGLHGTQGLDGQDADGQVGHGDGGVGHFAPIFSCAGDGQLPVVMYRE